jgi:hypothetical protein
MRATKTHTDHIAPRLDALLPTALECFVCQVDLPPSSPYSTYDDTTYETCDGRTLAHTDYGRPYCGSCFA